MNTVKLKDMDVEYKGKLGDLKGSNYRETKSAFVGTVGCGDEALWLLSYSGAMDAADPMSTFTDKNADVVVKRFVNVVIKEQ